MMKRLKKKIRKLKSSLFYDTEKMMRDIYDFCQNEMIIRQKADFTNNARFQYYRTVHQILNIKQIVSPKSSFKRIGREYDGGYVMNYSEEFGFSSAKTAYSFGINNDVSWDMDMAIAGYQIYQYDPTIKSLPIKHQNFHWKCLGLIGGGVKDNYKTLKEIMKDNNHETINGAVLKMDIEGFEWEVFANCSRDIMNRFDQIVMEVHSLTNMEKADIIVKALQNIANTHQIVHIHPNNIAFVSHCGNLLMPDTLELTFVKKDIFQFEDCDVFLPIDIDMPGIDFIPEIKLGYWNRI